MAFGNRLINTNAAGGGAGGPFTSATYLRDENVGVYTQSYYGISDFAYNQNDGLIYSTSRSGVGYWLLSKTDINTNTVTTIISGTSPLYKYNGIYVKNNSLYINEGGNSAVYNYSLSGSRGSQFINTSTQKYKMSYNSVLDEVIISVFDGTSINSFDIYDGTNGSFKRSVDLSSVVSYMEGFAWANTGGQGVILYADLTLKKIKQLDYQTMTLTALDVDISSYERDGRGFDAMAFIPTTNELIISTNSNIEAPRNMARVFQMA